MNEYIGLYICIMYILYFIFLEVFPTYDLDLQMFMTSTYWMRCTGYPQRPHRCPVLGPVWQHALCTTQEACRHSQEPAESLSSRTETPTAQPYFPRRRYLGKNTMVYGQFTSIYGRYIELACGKPKMNLQFHHITPNFTI